MFIHKFTTFHSYSRYNLFFQSLMTRKVPSHSCLTEHEASRSYQPSSTGIAAYYQAEQSGGLAVCPPLPRVPSTHHLHGEGPAEEVGIGFFMYFLCIPIRNTSIYVLFT